MRLILENSRYTRSPYTPYSNSGDVIILDLISDTPCQWKRSLGMAVVNFRQKVQGPVSPMFFQSVFRFVGIFFYPHLDSCTVTATIFFTWHDSCAVVACAKNCCDLMADSEIIARWIFHRILIRAQNRYWNGPQASIWRKFTLISCRVYTEYIIHRESDWERKHTTSV